MLRVVAICAVAIGCHLIVAADSDIDDYPKNKEFTTIVPERELITEEKEQNQTDIIDDDFLKNNTFVNGLETVIQSGIQTSTKFEEQDLRDIINDDNLLNETNIKTFSNIQLIKEPRSAFQDEEKTDIINDHVLLNETNIKTFSSIQPKREARDEFQDVGQADIMSDDYLLNKTNIKTFSSIQPNREPRAKFQDEKKPEENFCSHPPNIEGVVSPDLVNEKYPLGTVISYQCKFGYVSGSSGNLLSVCRIHGHSGKAEWTHPNVTCIPRSCGNPGYVVNGRRIGNLFTFPNSVKFECLEGYKLQGMKERYCQASGEWSGRLPTCVPTYCPVPSNPKNGQVLYSSLSYGSELEYKCDKGFMLHNYQPRICIEDGIWSNDEPECIETTCPIPEAAENGFVRLSEEPPKVGTLAFYSCNAGATLVGASTSKCLSSGDWTFDPPTCMRSCYVPKIQYGELGRNHLKNRYRQQFVLFQEGDSVSHHEFVTLRCKDGFSAGNRTNGRLLEVECNDGTWSELLQCHPNICNGQPPPVKNASPVIKSREHGHSIWYRCEPGYGKIQSGNVVCHYGKWEGPTPICGDYRCYRSELNYPGLIKPVGIFMHHGGFFSLDCEKAYKKESSWKKHVTCQKGKWDITTNPCIIKSCEDEPPSIEKGHPREFFRTNGSVVHYKCDEGYEMEVSSSVHCAFGSWDGNPPVCKPSIKNLETTTENLSLNRSIAANALKAISNSDQQNECFCTYDYRRDILAAYWGNSEIDSHQRIKKGERVLFVCRYPNMDVVWPNGLRFFERMNLTCDLCHDWQVHDLPSCETRASGDSFIWLHSPLRFLPRGVIEIPQSAKLSLTCFNPWTQPMWNASHTKKISFDRAYDSRQTGHFREDMIIDEMEYEHIGRYECFAMNYNQKLRPTIVHLKMDEYDVLCPELSTQTNLGSFEIIYSNQGKIHSVARYKCKDPLKRLVGPNERICMENGKWSSSSPACNDIRCPLLNENNVFIITYSNNRKVNSEANYFCKSLSQRLIGSSNRTCLHSGEWSGTNPVCEDITCPEFLMYNGLSVTYTSGTKIGSIANFNCLNHATLIGNSASRCLFDGTWSHPKPSCEMLDIHCPKIDGKGIFTIKYSNDRKVNSTAQFFCKAKNKKVAGCNFQTCQQNGEWSGDYPTCVDYLSCDLFSTSPNLNVRYTNEGRVGSIAVFQCLPPNTLVGISSATCLANGVWSHSLPKCQAPNCAIENLEESLPENLYVNLENITDMSVVPGTELPLICEEHLVLTGSSKALCNFHGKWEFADAQCISACRVNKGETSHLIVEPEKDYYRFGEFILLSCPPGQRLTNEVQRMMCLGRTWSDTLPHCVELTEPNPQGKEQTTRKI